MLARLQLGGWVDGPDLANEEVGGSEGLKRLRELRLDDHYDIKMRRHPDPDRDIFQYRLAAEPWVGSVRAEVIPGEALSAEQIREVAAKPIPEPAEKYDYKPKPEVTGHMKIGRTESGEYVAVYDGPLTTEDEEDAIPVLPGQMDMGVEEAEQYKYTKMPTLLELGRQLPCPWCHGYRRAIRERDPITNKQKKGGKILGYEDWCRNPQKPSETCPRCNGFGVVPAP